MTHVATLVSAPGLLGADLVGRAAAVLPNAATPRWLDAGTAADIPFAPPTSGNNARWGTVARAALDDAPIDVVVQPLTGRRKRLLVADMDSTLVTEECIDELADARGVGPEVARLTARSTRGEIDFADSLVARVALLEGLAVTTVEAVADRLTPTAGSRVLAATMRAGGATSAIASGSFTIVTSRVAARLGFDRHYANTLDVAGGRLSGTMAHPLFLPEGKRDVLLALCAELGIAPTETMAVGDGANDIPMLREAGLGVAFRAKPAVAAAAPARIDHGDLTALLYLQGFARKDFVA